jgi:hypothetical protein
MQEPMRVIALSALALPLEFVAQVAHLDYTVLDAPILLQ